MGTKYDWEIGVHPAGYSHDWEHYHPVAETVDEAHEKAREMARDDGMDQPMVYMDFKGEEVGKRVV